MAAAPVADDEPTSSIPVNAFNPETDDFQEWISLFEDAVVLATNVRNEARKKELFKTWLPLVLDERTRIIFRKCEKTEWDELTKELAKLLVDPQERYEWRAGRLKITWDQTESFHVLAARVTRAINKYEDDPRPSDFFHHFRNALPVDYMQAIDLGANAETIDEAMRVALRFRTAQSGKQNAPSSFTAASMSNDRINDLECALERMSVTLEDVQEETRQLRKRVKQLEYQLRRPRDDDDDGRVNYERDHREYDESRSRAHADRDGEREREHYDRNRRDREGEPRLSVRGSGSRDYDENNRDRRDRRYDDRDYERRDRH